MRIWIPLVFLLFAVSKGYGTLFAPVTSSATGRKLYFDMMQQLDLSLEQKLELDANMVDDMETFNKNEKVAEKNRNHARWVQSSTDTDKIGHNYRMKEAMIESINRTKSGWKNNARKKRQATNNLDIQDLIKYIGQSCENGEDVFEGSFSWKGVECNPKDGEDVYRRFDGVCNNLIEKNKGAAGTAMRRLTEPAYADGIFAPRQPSTNLSPREVSNRLHRQTEKDDKGHSLPLTTKGFTHMTTQWGQFLDHDITLTPQGELDCCNQTFLALDLDKSALSRRCLNIPTSGTCLPFTRSDVQCTPGLPREQFNANTAFIDGSQIYGSDSQTARRLRKLQDGLMIVNGNFEETNLPTRKQCGFESPLISPGGFNTADLVAGDPRVIIQPTLASLQTLFLKEHNRIAKELKPRLIRRLPRLNATEADELIYQQTRAIVGAELQQITYEEYLPVVLGSKAHAEHGLHLKYYSAYDPSADPSILNEFATVAFRFGHSTVSDRFDGNPPGWSLKNQFFKFVDFAACVPNGKEAAVNNNGDCWINELQEAIKQLSPAADLIVGDALREQLFNVSSIKFGDHIPEDLVARNIQRAREHGIPSYGTLRTACGMSALTGNNKPSEINQKTWDAILAVYGRAEDIDPFTGGLAEISPSDGIVGPLFACIIGTQFKLLRDGDRYFFTHMDGSHSRGLGAYAKYSILQRTFGDILCENQGSDIDGNPTRFPLAGTQRRVFSMESDQNRFVSCSHRTRVALDFDGIVDGLDAYYPTNCTIYPGQIINAPSVAGVDTKNSFQDCANWCAETVACGGWTFWKDYKFCLLKSSDEGRYSYCPETGCVNSRWISGTKACGVYSAWNSILDCYTGLALTADSSEAGTGLSTKSVTGADNQLWMMDSEGRVVNKQSGLVIDGSAGRPYLQPQTPLTSNKQWKIRTDIRSSQETDGPTVPKLVVNGNENCLNTGNRFSSDGSVIIMYPAKLVHPDNACWKTHFFEWKPILNCFTGFALTAVSSDEGGALSTKPVTGMDNQMWAFDSADRIVNKESGLVIDGSGGQPFMQQRTPLTDYKQWTLRTDIRSSQETDGPTVSKLVVNGNEWCLNTGTRFSSDGSLVLMYPAKSVHPDNACWKF